MDKKLLDIISRISSATECKIVVTGSLAMKALGCDWGQSASDLDLIAINPTDDDRKLFSGMQIANPSKYVTDGYLNSGMEVGYQFMADGVMVDIFVEHTDMDFPVVSGMNINLFHRIVEAKKRLGRAKDWGQLHTMCDVIMHGFDETIRWMLTNKAPIKKSNPDGKSRDGGAVCG